MQTDLGTSGFRVFPVRVHGAYARFHLFGCHSRAQNLVTKTLPKPLSIDIMIIDDFTNREMTVKEEYQISKCLLGILNQRQE
jgi:hypothetical protein